MDSDINAKYDERLKAFLCGENVNEISKDDVHYILAFSKFRTGSYINWNWAAFLLGSANFAYRKNWIAFVISLFLPGFFLRIIFLLFSDYLYYMKFNDACRKAEYFSDDAEEQREFLARAGGKNLVLGIIMGLLPLMIFAFVVGLFVFLASAREISKLFYL